MESNTNASNNFSWTDVNWNALRRLRTRFLQFDEREQGAKADHTDYWRSHSELASYDFTLAERIGWKWDTVLTELKMRGWTPPGGTLLDWGCGTGVAGRRVAAAWPQAFRRLLLADRSVPALHFAAERAREAVPGLEVREAAPADTPDLLVLSHVLNELSPGALEPLLALAARAQSILWVEPGTHPVSRQLIAVRERLLPQFRAVSPCTHQAACGMLAADNERHWCHHFARVPGFVHTDPGWGRFAQALELDLSSVPFSYLVLDRRPDAAAPDPAEARVIGEPRFYKGFAKILSCQTDGVAERVLQKRDAPELFKALKKAPGSLYRWERDAEKIRGGEQIF
ncbi:MAG: small ribosomal subunit Rsm22 family protein [Chthoniobacteraceae bacterium]|nr:small ribosomal subunit Rsm22 family protein [Chthoniobacteraceae bacterium]